MIYGGEQAYLAPVTRQRRRSRRLAWPATVQVKLTHDAGKEDCGITLNGHGWMSADCALFIFEGHSAMLSQLLTCPLPSVPALTCKLEEPMVMWLKLK